MHNNDDDNVKHYNTKGTGNNNNNRDPHIHSWYIAYRYNLCLVYYVF